MLKLIIVVAILTLFVVGHTNAENTKPLRAIAVINGPNGVYGNVTFSQNGCGESVLIEVSVVGLSPGEHGFHVHEKGDLSNGCLSTGGHYNPEKLDHGAPNDQVRHIGDLGNIRANEQGVAETKFSDQVITLAGHWSIVGRAVVIHSGIDDLGKTNHPDSKKTGNAGGRAGCGVIGIM
ncbi:extracellular superoxide dismutase [Cu-Zn] isoform X2 [Contarinia nasturtii]|uniref:extracellular superoxide dismutase [Cu-Zn] isoform X2 n=1 Tax=Contarinia nasturtii TaxID=265458 RepID=UPI0012D44ED0|nr:extracellular superoxide dismutase [Cu-Zn] isoform X2 [Contarinia nasturtii]